jgi:NAD(P)H-dependent FMN reductase
MTVFPSSSEAPAKNLSEKPARVDSALEEARWRRRSASRSARLSDAVLDQPVTPARPGRPAENTVVQKWTAAIAQSDGFVFVT